MTSANLNLGISSFPTAMFQAPIVLPTMDLAAGIKVDSIQYEGLTALRAELIKITDGDTAVLRDFISKKLFSVRLVDINTPEKGEKGSKEAADYLAGLLSGKSIYYHALEGKTDRERAICLLLTKDKAGKITNVNEEMIKSGWAHVFIYEPNNLNLIARFLDLQKKAKTAPLGPLGIWKLKRFQGPVHVTSFNPQRTPQSVRLANLTNAPINLNTLQIKKSKDGEGLSLPDVLVPPGQTASIIVGEGTDKTDPATGSLRIYLNLKKDFWSREKSLVIISGTDGKSIDFKRSSKAVEIPEGYQNWLSFQAQLAQMQLPANAANRPIAYYRNGMGKIEKP